MQPDVTHTHSHIHRHIHLCCQHFRMCVNLSGELFEDISEAMWAADYTLGATSNEILAQGLQVSHLRCIGGALRGMYVGSMCAQGGVGLFHLILY